VEVVAVMVDLLEVSLEEVVMGEVSLEVMVDSEMMAIVAADQREKEEEDVLDHSVNRLIKIQNN
jgi:hypothetical protein